MDKTYIPSQIGEGDDAVLLIVAQPELQQLVQDLYTRRSTGDTIEFIPNWGLDVLEADTAPGTGDEDLPVLTLEVQLNDGREFTLGFLPQMWGMIPLARKHKRAVLFTSVRMSDSAIEVADTESTLILGDLDRGLEVIETQAKELADEVPYVQELLTYLHMRPDDF